MNTLPYTPEAYDLMHQGAIALAEVESNGICIDVDYLKKTVVSTQQTIAEKQRALENTEVGKTWRKRYGTATNWQSNDQLGDILFNVMKFPGTATLSGKKMRYKVDEVTLRDIDDPFIEAYLEIDKLKNLIARNFKPILREVVRGKLHNFFNLHLTLTYRSSSNDINFQNIPIRDPVLSVLIRRAFVASPGRQLVELDISGAEVRVAACYHQDPNMISYINDKSRDMHRDMAMELFKLPQDQVNKEIRHRAKNKFVFPQFYGDWWYDCAPILWKEADKCTTVGGLNLKTHLKTMGFKDLGLPKGDAKFDPPKGTFCHHVMTVEKAMWNKRFPVYSQWKKDWFEDYRSRGWYQTLTGFICQGYMKKNEAINYGIQGSAFHCLLWSLIRIVRVELVRYGLKSTIIGQIHDSIVADVVPSELDEFLAICHRVMTRLIRRYWDWLIVPIEVEADVAPVGGSWADKKPYEIKE